MELIEEDSISISSIADDNVEGYINERCVAANKIIYYCRALRGGKMARIFRVIPGKDACFNCLSLYRKEGNESLSIPQDPNLPTIKNECNNPIRPASAADLKLISSLCSRLILDEIQDGFGEINHWIWSTELLGMFTPFKLHKQILTPHRDCYYCNHEKTLKIFLPPDVEDQMRNLVLSEIGIETGGVLAGRANNDLITITHASGAGPNAVKTPTEFKKDVEFCQKFLDDLFIQSNKEIVYIGEWHSHPNNNNSPSATDIQSLSEISLQENYLTDSPIMIIFSNEGELSCTVHPAGKLFYYVKSQVNYETPLRQ